MILFEECTEIIRVRAIRLLFWKITKNREYLGYSFKKYGRYRIPAKYWSTGIALHIILESKKLYVLLSLHFKPCYIGNKLHEKDLNLIFLKKHAEQYYSTDIIIIISR